MRRTHQGSWTFLFTLVGIMYLLLAIVTVHVTCFAVVCVMKMGATPAPAPAPAVPATTAKTADVQLEMPATEAPLEAP